MRTSVIILSCPSGCVPGDEFAPNGHLNIILTLHTIHTSKNFKTVFIYSLSGDEAFHRVSEECLKYPEMSKILKMIEDRFEQRSQ